MPVLIKSDDEGMLEVQNDGSVTLSKAGKLDVFTTDQALARWPDLERFIRLALASLPAS